MSQKRRIILILSFIAAYIYIFIYLYRNWTSIVFQNLGFTYRSDDYRLLIGILFIGIILFIIPYNVKRVGDFIIWAIFYTVYVPSILSLSMQDYVSFNIYNLMSSILFSFTILILISNLKIYKYVTNNRYLNDIKIFIVVLISILLCIVYLYYYHNSLNLVSFGSDIYDQRSEFVIQSIDVPEIVGYIFSWIAYVLNPTLLAIGLFERRYRLLIPFAFAGQLLIYAGFAGKMMVVVLIVQTAFFVVVARSGKISVPRIAWWMLVLIGIPLVVLEATNYQPEGVFYEIAALIYMRSLALQGAITGAYADFYATAANTYWSHSNAFSWLIGYPHDAPPGVMVGNYMSPTGRGMNANAHFWATDGIAAAGNIGVIVIGAVFGIILSIMNTAIRQDRLAFACTALIPFAMAIGNTSLLQSMITGGGLFTVFLIYNLAPRPTQSIPLRRH